MRNKIKAMVVFGTRPEAIKMAPLVEELKRREDMFDVRICVTAQHREMLDQVLMLFGIKPDYDLDIMTQKQSLSSLTANILTNIAGVFEKEKPDIVFVQGDTTTTFAAAQTAYYFKIPVAHVEAGLRTGDKYSPFPEEINRRLTSVIADFHFAPTEFAKRQLIKEGFNESSIYVTGNTVIDALEMVVDKHKDPALRIKWEEWFSSYHGIKFDKKTILVTGHRRESFGEGFHNICSALLELATKNADIQIIYPVHLNPNVQEPVYKMLSGTDNIHLIPPLDYEPFVFLMTKATIILTDSGGIQEEAPSLGIPLLVMRNTSERPEGIEAGAAKLVGTDTVDIVSATERLLNDKAEYMRMSKINNPYGDGKASQRIVGIISEYFRRNQ